MKHKLEDVLDEETKEKMKKAEQESKRSKTKWGDKL